MDKGYEIALLVLLAVLASACAAPVTEQTRTGFISDYSELERVSDNAYRYTSPELKQYSQFMLDDPEILFERAVASEDREFTDKEIGELGAYFRQRLEKALTENNAYEVVEEPGPGVARLRIAITALDATDGALNVSIVTKATGAGLGGAAMEGELVDSVTNEQLAAAVQWGSGSRVLRAGFTKLGDAKLQINHWTKNLRERIDAAHGRASKAGRDDQ